jgi:hypothetical protein
MIDWNDCVSLAATSTPGGSSSSKMPASPSSICRPKLSKAVDAPKAAAVHSVLNNEVSAILAILKTFYII